MRIDRSDSLFVVVDVQARLFPHIAENEKLLQKSLTLIEGMKTLGVKTVATEQYVKGLGETLPDIQQVLGNSKRIEKMSFSCCGEADFVLEMEEHYRKNVILCGIETHVCVLQTAIDLQAAGHQAVVVVDAVSSRNLEDKELALRRMEKEGVILASVESILLELCKVSGTDEFRAISKLIK
ncbi:MAG TPA: hydrolase [Flavobacteriales bacterium]|jgi:nicotinamidase-related amidase|nr:isochorismatase family protein [Salibacteraceae bacterium]HAS35696.1 hydrolase [Flavobacteriales bacterium]